MLKVYAIKRGCLKTLQTDILLYFVIWPPLPPDPISARLLRLAQHIAMRRLKGAFQHSSMRVDPFRDERVHAGKNMTFLQKI